LDFDATSWWTSNFAEASAFAMATVDGSMDGLEDTVRFRCLTLPPDFQILRRPRHNQSGQITE
jgi:hypothetical protein